MPERAVLRPAPAAVVAAVGAIFGVALATLDPAQRVEWSLYDASMRIATRAAAPAPAVVVVAIDEPSFANLNLTWPWPRRLHAALLDQLRLGGARAVGIDLLFDVPAADPEDDRILADAIRASGNVVLASDLAELEDRSYSLTQWSDPIPPLAGAAAALGAVRMPYDPDGVLRRADTAVAGRPTLAVAVAAVAARRIGPEAAGSRLIRFNGPPRRGILTVSYYQALDAGHLLPPGVFRGAVVFVGRSLAAPPLDQETADHFVTPVGLRMSGVEIHATAFDSLTRARTVGEPFASRGMWLLFCAVVGAAGGVLCYRAGPSVAGATTLVAIAGLAGGGYAVLAGANTRLPVVGPAIVLVLVYATNVAYRHALGARERRMIKHAFEHYVAPAIVDQMLADPSRLRLGGEEYEVTALFTDLENFTTLSERLTPAELQQNLTRFFQAMTDVLLEERATIDKFIGDAIMAYFGCPIPDPEHPVRACRAALRMQARLRDLNRERATAGLPPLHMRVGVNTGRVVAGNMGTNDIFNFTILGDTVNLASRLEGTNKVYGTHVLVGGQTWARVASDFEGREIDAIRVKGKELPVAIYELVAISGELDTAGREVLVQFAIGLRCYRSRQWTDAMAAFDRILRVHPDDGPSAALSRRCAEYLRQPPPEAWDGVYVMQVK